MEIKINLEKHMNRCYEILNLFGIVLAVIFQSIFHLKIYWNNFLFFKIHFWYQYIKII